VRARQGAVRSDLVKPHSDKPYSYLRHTWPVRVMHWINALAVFLLLMSGLQIFNAHPTLNWGKSSYTGRPPVLEIASESDGQGRTLGYTQILGWKLRTTGFLGASPDSSGTMTPRAFPAWMTVPGPQWLAMGRRWHFFLAWVFVINGLLYVTYSALSHHLSADLTPSRRDWKSIPQSIVDHLRFRHPAGDAARRYNVLQKLTYLGVIFVLLPFIRYGQDGLTSSVVGSLRALFTSLQRWRSLCLPRFMSLRCSYQDSGTTCVP
jgi:thiosulfate reductase cytochrome b subunit